MAKAPAATKEPRITVSKEAVRRLGVVTQTLADQYGPHIYPDEKGPALERIIFAVVAEVVPVTNVKKAMRQLREVFVDWNEVRIASLYELETALEPVKLPNTGEVAARLKTFLQQTFDALYGFDIQRLGEITADKRKRILKLMAPLPQDQQDYLLLLAGVDRGAPLGPTTERILERLGVLKPDDLDAKKRKTLQSLLTPEDALRFHHIMLEHGKKVCVEGTPKCSRCKVQHECAFGLEQAKKPASARSARPKSARKKSAAGSARAKTSRKKTTKAKRTSRRR